MEEASTERAATTARSPPSRTSTRCGDGWARRVGVERRDGGSGPVGGERFVDEVEARDGDGLAPDAGGDGGHLGGVAGGEDAQRSGAARLQLARLAQHA